MRAILLGGATGALLVYFLDPKKGTERRGRAGTLLNRGRSVAQQGVQSVGGVAQKVTRQSDTGPDTPTS